MTDRIAGRERSPAPVKHTLQWINAAGSSVPAFGVICLTAFNNTTGQYTAQKHDGTAHLTYVNGPAPVANGAYGGSMDWSASRLALVASGVTLGQEVGPVGDSWELSGAGTGFVVFSNRDAVTGTAAVVKIGGGGGGAVVLGIVSEDLGKGYYTIELAEWGGETPECDEEGPTGSAEDCDPCKPSNVSNFNASLSGYEGLGCGDDPILPPFRRQHIGTGVYVLAYDPASVLVPLELNTDCIVADTGASNALVGSGATSLDEEPVWHVVRGYQTHTVQFREEKECCDGIIVVTRKQAIFFAARVCDVQICSNCDQTQTEGEPP